MSRALPVLLPFGLATVLGCGAGAKGTEPDAGAGASPQPGVGVAQVVADLNARRANAVIGGQGRLAGVSVVPWLVNVAGGHQSLVVLEYGSTAALEADAAKVSSDGFKIGLSFVDWVATPHYYRNTRVIVIYVGCDPGMTWLLSEIVGPRFAGGTAPPIVADPCGV